MKGRDVEFDIIEYLKTPPTREALLSILAMLADAPSELVRKDKRFEELKLNPADYATQEKVIEVLLAHPELMQRPLVIFQGRAVIARPAEKLEALL